MKTKLWIILLVLLCSPFRGELLATPLLPPELASYSVLGATPNVTNTGATTLTGDIGVSPALSITGLATITINGTNGAMLGNPFVHLGDATASLAQSQLTAAITILGLLGPGILLPEDLAGLTLAPGVYTVPAGVSNLTGTLTLDGGGDVNALWVFQMPSSFITSPDSVVDIINTGPGAGLFWNVGSSATLDSDTIFAGNILALASITMGSGVTIDCGRALANTGTVTMINDSISIGCITIEGIDLEGSNGLNNFGEILTAGIPEPSSLILFGVGLLSLVVISRRYAVVA